MVISVVGNDLDASVLKKTPTTNTCSEINSNEFYLSSSRAVARRGEAIKGHCEDENGSGPAEMYRSPHPSQFRSFGDLPELALVREEKGNSSSLAFSGWLILLRRRYSLLKHHLDSSPVERADIAPSLQRRAASENRKFLSLRSVSEMMNGYLFVSSAHVEVPGCAGLTNGVPITALNINVPPPLTRRGLKLEGQCNAP
jgi:hypothetical protein